MPEERLLNSRDYFDKIVTTGYATFSDNDVTFLNAYAMIMGLFHLHEWVWHYDKAKVQGKFGRSIQSKGDFWKRVERAVPDAGLIRDMNNAAKHVKLDFDPSRPRRSDPSTTMHYAANTAIASVGFGTGGYGQGTYGGGPFVMLDEGGRRVDLDQVAADVYTFWLQLINEFYPPTV